MTTIETLPEFLKRAHVTDVCSNHAATEVSELDRLRKEVERLRSENAQLRANETVLSAEADCFAILKTRLRNRCVDILEDATLNTIVNSVCSEIDRLRKVTQ